jgi:hypothetical protein
MSSNYHCGSRKTVLPDWGIKSKLGHEVYIADALDSQPVS